LSFRDVVEILLTRGVVVVYETIRKGCRKLEQPYATQLRRRHPRPDDKWQMNEVLLMSKSKRPYVWRVVKQDGKVLDILVTNGASLYLKKINDLAGGVISRCNKNPGELCEKRFSLCPPVFASY
jgi:putative transposase